MQERLITRINATKVDSFEGVVGYISTVNSTLTNYARAIHGRSSFDIVCWLQLAGENQYGLILDGFMLEKGQELYIVSVQFKEGQESQKELAEKPKEGEEAETNSRVDENGMPLKQGNQEG